MSEKPLPRRAAQGTALFLIRDRDDKFGTALDALALATGIRVIGMAVCAPPT